jgi:hypothetical protein
MYASNRFCKTCDSFAYRLDIQYRYPVYTYTGQILYNMWLVLLILNAAGKMQLFVVLLTPITLHVTFMLCFSTEICDDYKETTDF